MADEEKKSTFKEKVKKALPWVLGGAGTVGGAILAYKIGKNSAAVEEELSNNDIINRYLRDRINDAKEGIPYAIGVMDNLTGDETYATIKLIPKPDWIENGYEITGESDFYETVTSFNTKG